MSHELLRCRSCRARTSLTAGTIFEGTRKPLRLWFLAMWFVTSQKNGVSALGLKRVLGLGSYETAWTWLHDSKLTHLEVRPVFVRNEARTRGHAFVVMLAYRIVRHLRQCWRSIDCTVQEGLDALATPTSIEVHIAGRASCIQIPSPRDGLRQMFEAAGISVPAALPFPPAAVSTKRNLPGKRKVK